MGGLNGAGLALRAALAWAGTDEARELRERRARLTAERLAASTNGNLIEREERDDGDQPDDGPSGGPAPAT